MNRKEALKAARKYFGRMTDIQIRNLMEHAVNKTPVWHGKTVGGEAIKDWVG